MLKGLHANQEKSRLSKISNIIFYVYTSIRLILDEMYDNKSEKGGRPYFDVIKILIPQKKYGFSDLEVERHVAARMSFMAIPGFPDPFPDSRSI